MTLPLLISVPHAGLQIPESLQTNCLLSLEQIIQDGDEFALDIYGPLKDEVAAYVGTDIARAALDMNRAEDDIRKDGVVKTHTCWDVPIWRSSLDKGIIQWLIDTYHKPYHRRLTELAQGTDLILAIDCHTMAAFGPPVGPDTAAERPQVCLGNAEGRSCPDDWLLIMQSAFQSQFSGEITLNTPFSGGYITKHHGSEMPWIQLELSRGDFASPAEKSIRVKAALTEAVEGIAGTLKASPYADACTT